MMNKVMNEATGNTGARTPEQIFEVVNNYALTTLNLRKDEEEVMVMQINQYESTPTGHDFFQTCQMNGVSFTLNEENLVAIKSEYNKEADFLHITCKLLDGMELNLMILNVENNKNEFAEDGWKEIDVYDLKGFLEETKGYYRVLVRVTNVFGLNIRIENPAPIYIDEELILNVGIREESDSLSLPLCDDSVNLFYVKESDCSKEVIIKPFGQPFLEIKMLFIFK
jgi:hypothetical protein